MSEDQMLKCSIAFVLGFLVARMVRGNEFSIGGGYNLQGGYSKDRSGALREMCWHAKQTGVNQNDETTYLIKGNSAGKLVCTGKDGYIDKTDSYLKKAQCGWTPGRVGGTSDCSKHNYVEHCCEKQSSV